MVKIVIVKGVRQESVLGFETARPTDSGAKGIVWAATLPDTRPTGCFFKNVKPINR
jgi:hypothetical protein